MYLWELTYLFWVMKVHEVYQYNIDHYYTSMVIHLHSLRYISILAQIICSSVHEKRCYPKSDFEKGYSYDVFTQSQKKDEKCDIVRPVFQSILNKNMAGLYNKELSSIKICK